MYFNGPDEPISLSLLSATPLRLIH